MLFFDEAAATAETIVLGVGGARLVSFAARCASPCAAPRAQGEVRPTENGSLRKARGWKPQKLELGCGYRIAQALFLSKRQVIVEGITDKWILSALDMALDARGRTRLRRDIVTVPSAGLSKLLPLASMLIGHDIHVAA